MAHASPQFVPFAFERRTPDELVDRARGFYESMRRRRSVRVFSREPVPRACVELAVRTAGTAPSGAHQQPWRFVIVDDPVLKRQIRVAAEEEERANYQERFPPAWLQALARLGTDATKPFLEDAPYLVVVFKESYGIGADGSKVTHYYVNESVGIACGLFIAAVHTMGLVTVTHTPNPMGFLSTLLRRPPNEKPYILFPIGYPAHGAQVPKLERKSLAEITQWNTG